MRHHGPVDFLDPRRGHQRPREVVSVSPACDFAFADTVVAEDLDGQAIYPVDDVPPASTPVIVNGYGGTNASVHVQALVARASHDMRASRDEIRQLWRATLEVVADGVPERQRDVMGRVLVVARRVRALWAFWQWDRTDLLRAAMIGIAVFLAAATVGASTFGR
jgi:hypothetical protein